MSQQNTLYQEEMRVQGMDNLRVRVRVEEGLSFFGILLGSDKLVVTNRTGNGNLADVVRKITPFDRRQRITEVYPMRFDAESAIVGYASDETGVVKVTNEPRYDGWRDEIDGVAPPIIVYYNLLTRKEIPKDEINM